MLSPTPPVLEGHALKVGSVLNKIGTKDSTLTVETSGSIVKLAVDKTKIQEKLIPITDATTSKAVLSGTTVRSGGVDNTLNIGVTSDVINLAVDKTKIQEKLTATADATSSKAVLSGATVRSLGVDDTLTITETSNVIKELMPKPPRSRSK